MTTQEYIQGLRKQLNGFSAEEQEEFMEEICSHIESGENDPDMGGNIEQRRKKLMAELGSPKDMGKNFKAIYRYDRFIDYLLIVIPYSLYGFLNMLYMSLMPRYPWADVRLDILIHLPLVALGLWRRSALVTSFWITTIATQIITVLLMTKGYFGIPQIVFGVMILLGLIILLGRIVWQNRRDSLIVMYALLPLMMCFAGSVLSVIHPPAVASYGFFERLVLNIYTNVAGSGGGYLPFYGTLFALALFFLTANRDIRWLALGLYGLVIGLSRYYVFDSDSYPMTPLVYSLYAILPLLIVFAGWLFSQSRIRQLEFAE